MKISEIKNNPRWTNTSHGIWHKKPITGKSWPLIHYERKCEHCGQKFAASNKTMRFCGYSCRSKVVQLGEKSHRWKGGRMIDGRGYIQILKRDHPFATKPNFYIREHRLVMETHLGRFLKRGESIHHINGIKHDNRLSNLQLLSPSEHARLHNEQRRSFQKHQ